MIYPKRITADEVAAIVSALPKRGEFTAQTVAAIARQVVPRLSDSQVSGLATLLKNRREISNGKNKWWYRVSAQVAPKTPNFPPDFHQEITIAPIAPTLRQHCAERTYTKAEVIEAFKAFYVREYDKMDDRAYTLTGFLLTALDEVL